MRIAQAHGRLLELLEGEHLDPDALTPWPAWRVFKRFLREPVADAYDAASVQIAPLTTDAGAAHLLVNLVRQFSDWETDEEGARTDEPLRRVVLELEYVARPSDRPLQADVWSQDFRDLAEFASVVEGSADFQRAMADAPVATRVYDEEL